MKTLSNKKILISILIALCSTHSMAANKNAQLKTDVTISPTCNMKVAKADFGTIDSAIWSFTETKLEITCSNSIAYSVRGMPQETGDWYHYMRHTDPSKTDVLSYLINYVGKSDSSHFLFNNAGIDSQGVGTVQEFPLYLRVRANSRVQQPSTEPGKKVFPGNYTANATITISY